MTRSIEQNKALIRRLYDEGTNRQDAEAAARLYAEDAVNHGQRIGRRGMKRVFQGLFAAFPDWSYTIEEMVAEADRVFCKVTMRGSHRGDPGLAEVFGGFLGGVPPTGRAVTVLHMHLFRIANGQIAEHAAVRDDLGMLRQLGLVQEPD